MAGGGFFNPVKQHRRFLRSRACSKRLSEVCGVGSRAEQRDICPGLEGFHASGRPDDLGPPGLPAERGSQRVKLTQMDPPPPSH